MKKDKQLHFIVSMIIAIIVGAFAGPLIGFTTAIIIGAGKEVFDYFKKKKGDVELLDFAADIIGAIIGTLVILW